ncbi:ATP-dependent RNA helicase dbp7 [Lithohypha guttulata]|uniref:ATP-dependent RNA helicase dbp7 n=1 Tax=Lithohypha guttulata TaxID=1690604 RepID=UPI00315DB7CE
MADDGFSLNFAVGDTVASNKTPKFKGGSWKERSRLTKAARNAQDKRLSGQETSGRVKAFERAYRGKAHPQAQSDSHHDNTQPSGQPPAKRQKHDHDNDGKSERPRRPRDRPAHLRDANFHGIPGQREVISSLFSFNPEAKTQELEQTQQAEEQEPVKPTNAPLPDGIDTFTSLGLSDSTAAYLLTKMNHKNPTAIQRASVSQLTKEDADVFIQSETGSGKTLAYLLPIVQRLITIAERQKVEKDEVKEQGLGRDSGLFAIVLAPTRELCKQISVVLEKLLGCAHYIVAGTVTGGERKKSEKARLRKGLNILVATPGRLVDHLENTEVLDVSRVRYLVLDEGDRLMDLGFEEDITKIVKALDGKKRKHADVPGLPERRVTILCSATLKSTVQKLGDISLKDAVLVRGEKDDESEERDSSNENAFLAPAQLKQSYIVCPAKLRLVTLVALLKRTFARKGSVMKAIVFFSCADSVDFHHKMLARPAESTSEEAEAKGIPDATPDAALLDAVAPSPLLSSPVNALDVYKIHGSLPQQTRTAIIKSFGKSTSASLLLATDVASRGLDLPNLDLVIECDPAFSKEDHLHRIGRTARLGRDGRAIIFLLPGTEEGYIDVLKESYKVNAETSATNVTAQSASDILKKGFGPSTGLVGSKEQGTDHETLATNFQLDIERYVLANPQIKEMAKNAFQSHIRAYATHIASERKYFDIKELHLGHLAKSFGLRDPPGKVNVQGLRGKSSRPKANEGRKRTATTDSPIREKRRAREVDSDDEIQAMSKQAKSAANIDEVGDAEAAAQKMRSLVRNKGKMMGGGADEFNLG